MRRVKVKKDVASDVWYVMEKICWRIGKLDWVIVEEFDNQADAVTFKNKMLEE